jgi:hypothetical protein
MANPKPQFQTPIFGGIFDWVEVIMSLGKCPKPVEQTKAFFMYACLPMLAAFQLASKSGSRKYAYGTTFVVTACFCSWIALLIVPGRGLWGLGWVMYLIMAIVLGSLRREVRNAKGVEGNSAEDMAACIFMYPNAMVQSIECLAMDNTKSA